MVVLPLAARRVFPDLPSHRSLLLRLVPCDHVIVGELPPKDVEGAAYGDVHSAVPSHPDPL